MTKLFMASALANLLILTAIAVILVSIMEYGTFLGLLIAIPLLVWASVIRFRVEHTVFINPTVVNRRR